MPDIERESLFVERLIAAVPELSAATVVRGEAPDFTMHLGQHRLGVELTEFHLSPEAGAKPYAEIAALRWRVVERAQATHAANGGPPLYVTCAFRDEEVIAKRDIEELSQQIAHAVLGTAQSPNITSGSVTVPWHLLPRAITEIWCWPSIDGKDLLWQPMEAGWVAEIPPEQVAAVIAKKSRKVRAYRPACDEVWLTIVHYFGTGAPARLSEAAASHEYASAFDRVVWFDPLVPKVLDLSIRAT